MSAPCFLDHGGAGPWAGLPIRWAVLGEGMEVAPFGSGPDMVHTL